MDNSSFLEFNIQTICFLIENVSPVIMNTESTVDFRIYQQKFLKLQPKTFVELSV